MSNKKKERLFFLDFIRAIATIMIVLFHICYEFNVAKVSNSPNIFFKLANSDYGKIGVALFFMITGCSLYYIYKDKLNIKEFYKKRFFSILPAFYIAYIICFIPYVLYKPTILDIPKSSIILTILGLDGYLLPLIPNYFLVGEWFLGAIIICYIIFPFLLKIYKKYPNSLLIILTICTSIRCNIDFIFLSNRSIIYALTVITYGMYFMDIKEKIKMKNLFWILPTILILSIIKIPIDSIIISTIIAILLFMTLYLIANYIKFKDIFNFLSKYSYYIFLLHHIIIYFFSAILENKNYSFIGFIILFFVIWCLVIISSIILKIITDFIINKIATVTKKTI